jgi:hypothetical protein
MAKIISEEMAASNNGMSTTDRQVSVSSVAVFLDKLINAPGSTRPEETGPLKFPHLQRFDSSRVPQVSLYNYMDRLKKYTHCDTAFIVALIYIDRISAEDPNFVLAPKNVHRLLLTCTTLAEKYINDVPYINTFYANVGGISLEELNRLEVILLNALMWRLGVSPEEYDRKEEEVRIAFVDALCASECTDWIVVKEAVCETQQEAVCETQQEAVCETQREDTCEKKRSNSEVSMHGSTISGSTISGDTESLSSSSQSTDSGSDSDSDSESACVID